jgi:hypothetical protein
LYAFDNQPVRGNDERVTKETVPVRVQIGTYIEEIIFDITRTSTYDAVFKLLWLELYKPVIRYKERTIRFIEYNCERRSETEILLILLSAISAYYR